MNPLLKKAFRRFGYEVHYKRLGEIDQDMYDPLFTKLYEASRQYTMTSTERMFSLYNATKYIVDNEIDGDIVECGVWKGGSSMLSALTLIDKGDVSRDIYLYDTYEGMPEPTAADTTQDQTVDTAQVWKEKQKGSHNEWCYSPLEEVKSNMLKTEYPEEKIKLIVGKVEETIPHTVPEKIALLRLDTDWYESTYHELVHLYPLVADKGVVIIDDYGYWKGCREAVDQYFAENNIKCMLNRIDGTGRIFLKT